jgi:hypothetical protein
MEWSARFVVVLLLRHGASAANELSENRDRLFAGTVDPINTYAVVGVGVFRDLEHIGRSPVVKFHGQRIRREDVVGDVTAPLSGDVFICHCVGDVCRTGRKQNRNRCEPRIFHDALEAGAHAGRDSKASQARLETTPHDQSPLSTGQ